MFIFYLGLFILFIYVGYLLKETIDKECRYKRINNEINQINNEIINEMNNEITMDYNENEIGDNIPPPSYNELFPNNNLNTLSNGRVSNV